MVFVEYIPFYIVAQGFSKVLEMAVNIIPPSLTERNVDGHAVIGPNINLVHRTAMNDAQVNSQHDASQSISGRLTFIISFICPLLFADYINFKS